MNNLNENNTEITRAIEIYDFLSTCDKDDFCYMVDTSVFNKIMLAFFKLAMNEARIDVETENSIINQLSNIFNQFSTKEILEQYGS